MLTPLEIGFITAGAVVLVFGTPLIIHLLGLQVHEPTEEKLIGAILAIYFCACIAFLRI